MFDVLTNRNVSLNSYPSIYSKHTELKDRELNLFTPFHLAADETLQQLSYLSMQIEHIGG